MDIFKLSDITFISHRKALVELCLRNALKFAMGDVPYSTDLCKQIEYAYQESSEPTRDLMRSIFRANPFVRDFEE